MSAAEILGVAANASEDEVRSAYLEKVKQFPPDRSPEEFERIRDAYEKLRDPRSRAKAMLIAPDTNLPLVLLVDSIKRRRIFAGPQPWREVLKSK
jgi:DnaJ domain